MWFFVGIVLGMIYNNELEETELLLSCRFNGILPVRMSAIRFFSVKES